MKDLVSKEHYYKIHASFMKSKAYPPSVGNTPTYIDYLSIFTIKSWAPSPPFCMTFQKSKKLWKVLFKENAYFAFGPKNANIQNFTKSVH